MSFVTAQPELLTVAAGDLQGIGSAISAGSAAAAGPTTGVIPAAADEVSTLTAVQFAAHAAMYQEISTQATAMHDQFAATLAAAAGSYAATEAANAAATG
jgi:PE family protein